MSLLIKSGHQSQKNQNKILIFALNVWFLENPPENLKEAEKETSEQPKEEEKKEEAKEKGSSDNGEGEGYAQPIPADDAKKDIDINWIFRKSDEDGVYLIHHCIIHSAINCLKVSRFLLPF